MLRILSVRLKGAALTALCIAGCGGGGSSPAATGDASAGQDATTPDGGGIDAGAVDAVAMDAGATGMDGAAEGGADAGLAIPIHHVLVIIKENHTFDNYFGSFPGAEGRTSTPISAASATARTGPSVTSTRS
jgi:phospholipase C